MKFSTLFVGAFAALAAAQGSEISSAASSAVSSVASSATGGSSSSRASSSGSSSASAANSASSSSASQTSGSSSASASGSGSVTSSASVHTTTIFYQYPNTFHKPVSPTLLGSTVITSTDGQSASSMSLPKGASTFDVTIRNVTTTFVYTNTFHGPVSKTWLTTESYVTTEGLPGTSTTSSGNGAGRIGVGALGGFALGVAALL